MLLKEKVALVTGASRGIGRAIAIEFARQGAHLILCGRDSKALEKTQAECNQLGAISDVITLDLQKSSDVENCVQKILDTHGRIDILVNNAGITRDNLLLRMSEDDWDQVLATNLKGAFLMTRSVVKSMIRSRSGRIIQIASVIGLTGNAGQANYAASKAGLIGFSKSVAKEIAKRNITVNVIAPGFIETDMTKALPEKTRELAQAGIPLGRFGQTSDVANAAVFLASDMAAYMTGQVLVVDGGMVI